MCSFTICYHTAPKVAFYAPWQWPKVAVLRLNQHLLVSYFASLIAMTIIVLRKIDIIVSNL